MQKATELSSLRAGELAPGSLRVDQGVLDDFVSLGALNRGVVAVPTPEGGVALEWSRGNEEHTAVIASHHRLFMCVDNVLTDDLAETEVSFAVSVLRRFMESGEWA